MNIYKKIKDILYKINFVLMPKHKAYAIVVLVMGVLAAVLEMLGVAIIIPVLDVLLDMSTARKKWYIKPFISLLRLQSDVQIVLFVCIAVILVYLFKNMYFIFYSWVSAKYTCKIYRELSIRVLNSYMRQGYIFFLSNNTSRLMQGIGSDISGINNILKTIFSILTKILTIMTIGIFILAQSKSLAITLLILSVGCLCLVQFGFRKSMVKNGMLHRELSYECGRLTIEVIQGSKQILMTGKQKFFVKTYEDMLAKAHKASINVELGAIFPSYIIEVVCISGLLIAVMFQIGNNQDIYSAITQLSTIAIGAFRILPALGAITSGFNTITSCMPNLNAAYQTLKEVQQMEENFGDEQKHINLHQGVTFKRELVVKDVSFKYPESKEFVLKNINLIIPKGSSVAFIGPSGAGKTTLSDIVLALLKPSFGTVLMDGIDIEELGGEWNRIIGYVPQNVYIVDDSIKRNIAFGEATEKIDEAKVWEVLKIAQLDEYVKTLRDGIETRIGEMGNRFSGGQRQRLAIARALYRNPEILVLDEATASLDNETEADLMNAIEALQGYKTMIIIAHRLTTIRKCDMVYEVKGQAIVKKNKEDVLNNKYT